MRAPASSFAVFLALAGAAVAQQSPKKLTLDDCIRLARGVPSTVSLTRQESEIARSGVTTARSGFLPRTELRNGIAYNSPLLDDRSQFSFVPMDAIRAYSFALTAVQEFDTSGGLRADLARARAGRDAATSRLALAERDLKRAVTAAYYKLLLTRHVAEVVHDAVAESESFEQRTKLLFEHGEAARADVVKASSQVAFLRQSLREAELQARLTNQALASFWTQDVDQTLALEDVLDRPAPSPEPGETGQPSAPFMRRIEFNLLDAQRRMFDAEARGARSAMLPQLSFVFQYGIDSDAVRMRNRGYAAFLNLNIPIFDWLKAHSETRQFRLRARQVETGRAIAERTFSREYRGALARVEELFGQIDITKNQVELAREDLRLSRVRYVGGEGSALDVVTAQNWLAQARTNYYTAVASYWNARADLEVAAGR